MSTFSRQAQILVVESKGEIYWSNDDSKEKRALGELWAERSGGLCLFIMPKELDWSAIETLLQSPPRSGGLFCAGGADPLPFA